MGSASVSWKDICDPLYSVFGPGEGVDYAESSGIVQDVLIAPLQDIIRYCAKKITECSRSVLLVASYYEKNSMAAFLIRKSLLESKAPVVHIVVDNGTLKNVFSHRRHLPPSKLELQCLAETKLEVSIVSYHVPILGTMHGKFIVLDYERVIISSNNIQDRPNIEMAVLLSGPIVGEFIRVFNALYGSKVVEVPKEMITMSQGAVEILLLNRMCYGNIFPEKGPIPQNVGFTILMERALRSIVIITPTLNVRKVLKLIKKACIRGVVVSVLLTKHFNDKKEALPFQGGTNQVVAKRLRKMIPKEYRKNLILKWFTGEGQSRPRVGIHCHVKALVVDGQYCMFGNANMDTQSWYHSMEANVLVNDAATAKLINQRFFGDENLSINSCS